MHLGAVCIDTAIETSGPDLVVFVDSGSQIGRVYCRHRQWIFIVCCLSASGYLFGILSDCSESQFTSWDEKLLNSIIAVGYLIVLALLAAAEGCELFECPHWNGPLHYKMSPCWIEFSLHWLHVTTQPMLAVIDPTLSSPFDILIVIMTVLSRSLPHTWTLHVLQEKHYWYIH